MTTHESQTNRWTPSNKRTAILGAAMVVWFVIGAARYATVGGLLWLGLAIFGLIGAAVYGLMLLPGSSYLEATPDGITISTAFRKKSYTWDEIGGFSVEKMLSKEVIQYQVHGRETTTDGAPSDARLRDETLPDTYGLSPDELCAELNAMHRRYSAQ